MPLTLRKSGVGNPPFITEHGPQPACREKDVDPDWFFPLHGDHLRIGGDLAKAQAVCRRCPLRDDCGDWGADTGQYGVWGGLYGPALEAHGKCRRGTCAHPEHRWSQP